MAVNYFYSNMLTFIDNTAHELNKIANGFSGKSDNPEDYLSKQNLQSIEKMYLNDPVFVNLMITIGKKLKTIKNKDRKKALTIAYANEISKYLRSKTQR